MLADSTYCHHWDLNHSPFRGDLGADAYYEVASHQESLARLHYLVDERRRCGLLLGSRGTGKTLLLEILARQLREKRNRVAVIDLLGVTSRELLWQLTVNLGCAPAADDNVPRLWRRFVDRVREHRMQELGTVLLFDDITQSGPDVMTMVSRIGRLDSGYDSRMTILAAADSAQCDRLGESLIDLVDLKTQLRSWEKEETIGYVQMALVDAGRESPLFDADALEAIHQLSQGIPRQINRLAEAALIRAADAGETSIDADMIEGTQLDLGWRVR